LPVLEDTGADEIDHDYNVIGLPVGFSPPVIRQKPPEQMSTNVDDLDRETLILLEFPDRVLRS
jgi:hypothetical protein